MARALLVGRASFLWSNTTASQRKSYFYAGVSYDTGTFLDKNAAQLTHDLIKADTAFAAGHIDVAIQAVIDFAELIFQIEPFKPNDLFTDWKAILQCWIKGINLADLSGGQEEAVIEMIEGAFVYRLVWALEAMRVRNAALTDDDEPESAGRAALAVETGTYSVSTALLIQSGVPSRVAAVKAVGDCPASFHSLRGLKQWLFSAVVRERQAKESWPTVEMHRPWMEFVAGFENLGNKRWENHYFQFDPKWESQPPEPGSPVRIFYRSDSSETVVYSIDLERLGTISPSFSREPAGLFTGNVSHDHHSLDCVYTGPSDIVAKP